MNRKQINKIRLIDAFSKGVVCLYGRRQAFFDIGDDTFVPRHRFPFDDRVRRMDSGSPSAVRWGVPSGSTYNGAAIRALYRGKH